MEALIDIGIWIYAYCEDFCLNVSFLLGIDYITFGSLFFGFFMNGIIVLLIIFNLLIFFKHKKISKNWVMTI